MAYQKPDVLVYQQLENAGGATNSTPDQGAVIIGPLFNVITVDTTSESSLTATLGAASANIQDSAEPTVTDGPNGLRINLSNTKPGQIVDQASIIVYGTNAYVKTLSFSANVANAEAAEFDGATFRSRFIIWDSVTETYNAAFSPAGATPHAMLPDSSGTHARLGDKAVITYTSPDAVGGTVTYDYDDTTKVVTVNCSTGHGLKAGDRVYLDFGGATELSTEDGSYTVVSANLLSFTVIVDHTGSDATEEAVIAYPVKVINTLITKVESGVDTAGNTITSAITVAQPIEVFTATTDPVTATIEIFRFYDQIVVPASYISGVNTVQQFDLDTADDDYIWLLTDTGPAAYGTVTYGTPDEYSIRSGNFHIAYTALRQDKYSTIIEVSDEATRLAELGDDSEKNPLSLAVRIAMANTSKVVMAVSLKVDESGDYEWTRALDLIENKKGAYAIVPLTQDDSVIAQFKAHAVEMSLPENHGWRVVCANTAIPAVKYVLQANANAPATTGSTSKVGSTLFLKDLVHTNASSEATGEFIGSGVTPGDLVVVTAVTGATIVNQAITITSGLTTTNGTFYKNTGSASITIGTSPNHVVLKVGEYAKATGATAAVKASPEDLKGSWVVDEVTNSNYLKLADFEDLYATHEGLGITYYVIRNLTRAEQAAAVAAQSTSFGSNRCWHIQPDVVGVEVSGGTKYLPGYYLAAGHAGMVSGNAPQQGFTNLTVAGISDLQNSNFYFKKAELDLMAEAGTCLYVQETQGSTPYCRHAVTTDMSVLEYREQLKVKNWDFISAYFYYKVKPFIGTWNITEDTLSNIKQSMTAGSEFLIAQKLPRIGAPLLAMTELTVTQNAVNKDSVDVRCKVELVSPNNYTNIYLVI